MNLRELQPYVIGWIRDYLSQVLAGALTILRLVVTDLTVIGQVVGSLVVSGDLYTVPWTDYSASSTVTGWSSFNAKQILCKRVGKLVFVQFFLHGTSDNTIARFTVPYVSGAIPSYTQVMIKVMDNGVTLPAPGLLHMPGSGSLVHLYKDVPSNPWTAGGDKLVIGEFFYEAAA
jgi:hypothetical protein